MELKKLKSIELLFENGEALIIDGKAINSIDMSELIRDVQVVNGYIMEQITSKYILIEFNKNIENFNYLNDKHMFGITNNGLLTLEESLNVHFNKSKDIVSFKIQPVEGKDIKINVPWCKSNYMKNNYMEFIETKNAYVLLFDSSKNNIKEV